MPSPTFDRFLKQLRAQGMEKADGFDPSHFDGLSQDERLEAFRLLQDALLKGDDTAAHDLVLLDPQGARPALEAAWPKYKGDALGGLNVAEELWGLTGESRYRDFMVDSLRQSNRTVRQRALMALRGAPHDDRLMTALQSVILNDPDEIIRSLAATHLLYGLGLVASFQAMKHPYRQIENDLSDERREVRERALAELKRKHSV